MESQFESLYIHWREVHLLVCKTSIAAVYICVTSGGVLLYISTMQLVVQEWEVWSRQGWQMLVEVDWER